MIQDRFIIGIKDISLSEHLKMNLDLTLEKDKKSIHQRGAVHEQHILSQKEFNPSKQSSVDSMQTQPKQCTKPAGQAIKPSCVSSRCSDCRKISGQQRQMLCKRCSLSQMPKKGHYSFQCYENPVMTIDTNNHTDPNIAFLDTIHSNSDIP